MFCYTRNASQETETRFRKLKNPRIVDESEADSSSRYGLRLFRRKIPLISSYSWDREDLRAGGKWKLKRQTADRRAFLFNSHPLR